MNYYIQAAINLGTQLLPAIIGLTKWLRLDYGTRSVVVLSLIGFIGELTGVLVAIRYRNNLVVYNVISLLLVLGLCIYFQYILPALKKPRGYILGFISLLVWVWSVFIDHQLFLMNSFYTKYECILTISLSIIFLQRLVTPGSYEKITDNQHFWIALLFLFSWSLIYVQWNHYDFLVERFPNEVKLIDALLFYLNVMFNLLLAGILFVFPKNNYASVRRK